MARHGRAGDDDSRGAEAGRVTRLAALALLAAWLALPGCAAGLVVVHPDDTCVVAGVAIGRAEIAAYRTGATESRTEDEHADTESLVGVCARLGGGSGSAAWWTVAGASISGFIAHFWP